MTEAVEKRLAPELLDLMEHEKLIEQGIASMLDMAWSWKAIRDERKYRAAGFERFEDYCRERWGLTRQHVNRVIEAGEIIGRMEPTGSILPTNESQLRPLKALPDPDERAEAWNEAVDEADGQQPTARQVEKAVKRISKPDLGDGVSHPARFSDELLPIFADALDGYYQVLDPFAGTGRIHELAGPEHETVGVEIEPEWAAQHARTVVGDALALPYADHSFDAICTSPTYGNRLADHHNASDPDKRRSYTHDLGRSLRHNNSGQLQWGDEYRTFHERAWREAWRVLRLGGRFVLNISDHIRDGNRQPVSAWHVEFFCCQLGAALPDIVPVETRRMRAGTNSELRPIIEYVFLFDKVEQP